MYTRIRLLLLIHPFISSFFFLSNFQTLKFFTSILSGTVRPRRLKLGTHVGSGWMYHAYQNQTAAAYSSLYFFIFLSLEFSTLKFFITLFSGTVRLEDWNLVHTKIVGRCIMYSGIRLLLLIHPIISSFFFLFSFQTLKFLVTLFSGTVRLRRLKLCTNWDSGLMYRFYRNQASSAYLSYSFFIFLFLQLSNIKNFRHIFLRNCEV